MVDRLGSAATAVDGSSLWAVRAIATKNDKQEKIHKKRINLTLPFQKKQCLEFQPGLCVFLAILL